MRTLFFIALSCCAFTACTGPLYGVAPIPKAPAPDEIAVAESGLEVGAAFVTEDRALREFDANLPLAGVIGVDFRVTNRSEDGVRLSFILNDNERSWKTVPPKKALSRVMKYYGIRFYGKESTRQTREAYDSVGFNSQAEIQPGEERRGIVFFDLKKSATNLSGLVLEVKGAGKPILLTIN